MQNIKTDRLIFIKISGMKPSEGSGHEGGPHEPSIPIHRIGMKVVSKDEWAKFQTTQGRNYERDQKKQQNREFDNAQTLEWKTGLHQSAERASRAGRAFEIANHSLVRSPNAADLAREQKERRRWEDPLDGKIPRDETFTEVKPRCTYQAPSNRFQIPAGYRWDGVVRGNDFERRWFERQNEKVDHHKNSYRQAVDL